MKIRITTLTKRHVGCTFYTTEELALDAGYRVDWMYDEENHYWVGSRKGLDGNVHEYSVYARSVKTKVPEEEYYHRKLDAVLDA